MSRISNDGKGGLYMNYMLYQDIQVLDKKENFSESFLPQYIIYPCNNCNYNIGSGGITVCFYMIQLLKKAGVFARICCSSRIDNPISTDYVMKEEPFDKDNTIVIYGETVEGNPLNAKHIIRWILGPYYNLNTVSTWNLSDLVYFFNYEEKNKFVERSHLIGSLYKMLTTIYINPIFKNIQIKRSISHCHMFHKARIYHKEINNIHPDDSIQLQEGLSHDSLLIIFNTCDTFLSYDPITFSTFIAALCGCISVVCPIKNVSEKEWIDMTCLKQYANDRKISKLNGISYGYDNIEHAKKTIHLVQQQWDDILDYLRETSINPFLSEMTHIKDNSLPNTVKNIYYYEHHSAF